MPITSLSISDFRNLATVDLVPDIHGLNIICGKNGSGKTSLLEAIYFLSYGKSFRTSVATRLIKHQAEKFSLFSQVVSDNLTLLPIGVERTVAGFSRLRMAGSDAGSITELASLLPIRVINSQSHHLLESGPVFRRKFLDWGLFYQSTTFFSVWKQFERVLKQRNAVLKARLPKRELDVWSEEIVRYACQLDHLRRDYIDKLRPILIGLVDELLDISRLDIHYYAGWEESVGYDDILADSYYEDMRYGHTQYGPHRADIEVLFDGLSAKHFLSRGQQKLLICAMILAQGMLLSGVVNKSPIYLVDDLPAELDETGGRRLISLLSRQQAQVFITAINRNAIQGLIGLNSVSSVKVFHVEHGCISEG